MLLFLHQSNITLSSKACSSTGLHGFWPFFPHFKFSPLFIQMMCLKWVELLYNLVINPPGSGGNNPSLSNSHPAALSHPTSVTSCSHFIQHVLLLETEAFFLWPTMHFLQTGCVSCFPAVVKLHKVKLFTLFLLLSINALTAEGSLSDFNKSSCFLSNLTQTWGRVRGGSLVTEMSVHMFIFLFFLPENWEQWDGLTPTCVLHHIY